MGFFLAMCMITLPLFLVVCASMLKQSELGKTVFGKILEIIFYIFAAGGILLGLYLISKI
jgi:hypothetical protein